LIDIKQPSKADRQLNYIYFIYNRRKDMSAGVNAAAEGASGCSKCWSGFQTAAVWLGRKIVIGWNNYILPALKVIGSFLRTGFGLATLGILAGTTLLALAHIRAEPGSCLAHTATRITLNVLAILCFIGAGAAMVAGTAILI
jgi:hypothetical protein